MKQSSLLLSLLFILAVSSCRQDDYVILSETYDTGWQAPKGNIVGMYLLNEGNMGSNKASLDYLDLSATTPTAPYVRNIYAERNPDVVKELGDVGNDVQIYGSKLWIVVNASNKVEVATANSCKRLTTIDIPNCRNIAFNGKYAYISSFVGPIKFPDPQSPLGMVYKVDTATFEKVAALSVGYQPEELSIIDNKLYVANSGGYRPPHYDRTISEIDLYSFKELRKIDVDINPHRCRTDRYGQLWVTTRGNYGDISPRLYWLSKDHHGTLQLGGVIDIAVSGISIVGDSLYYYGAAWNNATGKNTITYGIVNVRTHQIISNSLSSSPQLANITMPYGIMVNPINRDFYLMDAKNYVSSGELLHFTPDGTFDWKVKTGDIPGHAAFVYKKATP